MSSRKNVYICRRKAKSRKMKKNITFALLLSCLVSVGCTGQNKEQETEVVLETTAGNIRVKLYNDTPGHRDNFVRNVKEGLYTGVTFHRVIRNFSTSGACWPQRATVMTRIPSAPATSTSSTS